MTSRLSKKPMAINLLFGLLMLVVLLTCAALSFFWTPHNPVRMDFSAQLLGPTWQHLLGTDNFGRDTLSRLLMASRTSVLVGFISVGIGTSVGLLLGLVSGWFAGIVDDVVMRILDALSAFPTILLALLLAAVLKPNIVTAMLAVGISNIPSFARLARAGVLATKNLDYVDGARALGANDARILLRHVLPNIASALVVQASFSFGIAILAEAALSYLGLGTQPPAPSWGVMLRDAQTFVSQSVWASIFPGVAIAVTVLGFNLLGDGLRDRLDVRD